MVWLIENVVTLFELFARVALADPVSAVLALTGALLTGFTVAVGAYLSLGALADLLTPEVSRAPPR